MNSFRRRISSDGLHGQDDASSLLSLVYVASGHVWQGGYGRGVSGPWLQCKYIEVSMQWYVCMCTYST